MHAYSPSIRGSYDPNGKSSLPQGAGPDKAILPGQELSYLIRFQNTGTDTAYEVVIRDTLDPSFDLISFRRGAASHAYSFEIFGKGILEWRFSNIYLPDSNTNEPKSHGFVQYYIRPKSNAPLGTQLSNSAAIYFDNNVPVITNTTTHTIQESLGEKNASTSVLSPLNEPTIRVYPNPSKDRVMISVEEGKKSTGLNFST